MTAASATPAAAATTLPADGPVTVVVTRVVRPGREEAFEAAVRAWVPTSLAYPGHLGVHMLRPPPGGREYGAVLTFQTRAAWEGLRDSVPYRAFLESLREHLAAEPRVETATGLEGWFTPPGTPVALAPPRWKMALVTWAGVDLTAFVLSYTLSPLTAGWPWFLAFLTFNAGVVAGLTWVVMPVLGRVARPWLAPHASAGVGQAGGASDQLRVQPAGRDPGDQQEETA